MSDIREKKTFHRLIFTFNPFSYLTSYKGLKLALLHRVKERKPSNLSDYACGYTLFPEGGVVWKIPYFLLSRKSCLLMPCPSQPRQLCHTLASRLCQQSHLILIGLSFFCGGRDCLYERVNIVDYDRYSPIT